LSDLGERLTIFLTGVFRMAKEWEDVESALLMLNCSEVAACKTAGLNIDSSQADIHFFLLLCSLSIFSLSCSPPQRLSFEINPKN
jgi:hypothetical protein